MSAAPCALLDFDGTTPYRELRDPPLPPELRERALACFAAQRAAVATAGCMPAVVASGLAEAVSAAGAANADAAWAAGAANTDAAWAAGAANGRPASAPGSAGDDAVSDAALARLLAAGEAVGGIVTRREIATAIPFNARHATGVVRSRAVAAERRRVDAALARWVRSLFAPGTRPILVPAGQWWYPPGTWFGWHTNQAYPGWRLYLSHAAEAGRSLFRYRDPVTGAVATSLDARWHLRFFAVAAERDRLLWHAIHSETDRFSIGWIVRPWSLRAAAAAGVARAASLARR